MGNTCTCSEEGEINTQEVVVAKHTITPDARVIILLINCFTLGKSGKGSKSY